MPSYMLFGKFKKFKYKSYVNTLSLKEIQRKQISPSLLSPFSSPPLGKALISGFQAFFYSFTYIYKHIEKYMVFENRSSWMWLKFSLVFYLFVTIVNGISSLIKISNQFKGIKLCFEYTLSYIHLLYSTVLLIHMNYKPCLWIF